MKSFVLSLALTAGVAMGGDIGGGLELEEPNLDFPMTGDIGGIANEQILTINSDDLNSMSSQTMEDFNADLNALHLDLGAELGQKEAEEPKVETPAPVEEAVQEEIKPEDMVYIPQWDGFMPLTPENFESDVIGDSEHAYIVAFVSPGCQSCKDLSTEFRRLMRMSQVKSLPVRIGYVNLDNPINDPIIQKHHGGHDLYYTPTILYYGKDKQAP